MHHHYLSVEFRACCCCNVSKVLGAACCGFNGDRLRSWRGWAETGSSAEAAEAGTWAVAAGKSEAEVGRLETETGAGKLAAEQAGHSALEEGVEEQGWLVEQRSAVAEAEAGAEAWVG